MAKVDYVKINNTINYIQNVAYLSELPVANENSADFVSVNNELYVKQVNGTTYTYAKVGGSGGTEVIERTIIEQGSDYLVFAEQLTQDEFNTIANNDNVIVAVKNSEGLTFYLNKILNADLSSENLNQFVFMGLFNDEQYGVAFMSIDGELITQGMFNKIGASEPTVINLNTYVPSTATNGTLNSSVLATLQASDSNYIVFNNEIFKLADKQHNEGYLVYSHNGHDTTGCFFQKCITITLSTRGWVLEEQENQPKLVSGTNIKTINNQSILGSGNITIEGGGSSNENIVNATLTTELDAVYNSNVLPTATIFKLDGAYENADAISVNMEGEPSVAIKEHSKDKSLWFYIVPEGYGFAMLCVCITYNNNYYMFVFESSTAIDNNIALEFTTNIDYSLNTIDKSIISKLMKNTMISLVYNTLVLYLPNKIGRITGIAKIFTQAPMTDRTLGTFSIELDGDTLKLRYVDNVFPQT